MKARNLKAVLVFVDFSKASDYIHRGKHEEIMLAYGIPQETVIVIMMLYKNSRSIVRCHDEYADLFDLVAGVLQGDTLAPYLLILCLDYAFRTTADLHTDLGFTLEKARSTRHPAKSITEVDYTYDLALLSDTMDKSTKLLHYIEEAASEIGLYISAGKTSYNQEGEIKLTITTPSPSRNLFT